MSRVPNSDTPEPFVIATAEPRRPSARAILFAGVAGACALGVGAGLWARPGLQERKAALEGHVTAPPPAAPPASRLQIVVDDHARAPSAPLEVLAASPAAPSAPATAQPPPWRAPVRPPEGLMKASSVAPAPQLPLQPPAPAAAAHEASSPLRTILPGIAAAFAGAKLTLAKLEHAEPPHVAVDPPAAPEHKAELKRAQARELEIAEADATKAEAQRSALEKAEYAQAAADRRAAAKAEAAARAARRAELAKAAAVKAEAHRMALAKAAEEKAEKAEAVRLAKAQTAKAAAQHRAELARQDRAEKAEAIRLAKAQARAKAAQREEARLEALADAAEAKKRAQLARLARAVAHAILPHDKPAPVQLAKAERRHAAHEAKLERASARRHHEPPPRLTPTARRIAPPPQPMAPQPADGLVRVSTDPGLSAAERQLARAYQGARAAGVPEGELQRGQQRWLAARSAAAREAPWAVHDIYMARIAELNGQAKEAQGGY